MATKGLSLLDKAKAIPKAGPMTWFRRIPEPKRSEVLAVLKAYINGEVDASVDRLAALFRENGIAGATYHKVKSAIESIRIRDKP